jgi:hypothetical protein
VLVGAIVIDDQVRRQILGHLLVDPPQEAQELLVPVPGPAAPLRPPRSGKMTPLSIANPGA